MAAPAAVYIAVAKIRVNCSKFRSNAYSEHLSSIASPILTICNGESSADCDAATLRGEEPHRAHKCRYRADLTEAGLATKQVRLSGWSGAGCGGEVVEYSR